MKMKYYISIVLVVLLIGIFTFIYFNKDNKVYEKITVAIHNGTLSHDLSYRVLLGGRFL